MADYCWVYGVIHFTSPAGWPPVHRDQLRAQRSVTSMGKLYLFNTGIQRNILAFDKFRPQTIGPAHNKQVATVTAVICRIAAASQIDPSYSPGGASVNPHLIHRWTHSSTRVCAQTTSWSFQPFLQGSPVWLTQIYIHTQNTERGTRVAICRIHATRLTRSKIVSNTYKLSTSTDT